MTIIQQKMKDRTCFLDTNPLEKKNSSGNDLLVHVSKAGRVTMI